MSTTIEKPCPPPSRFLAQRNRSLSPFIPLVVVMCLSVGCGPRNANAPNVKYRLGESKGQLTLSMGKATLIFEGIAGDSSSTGSGSFVIPALEGSTSGSKSESGKLTIKTLSDNTQCTVSIDGYSFKLIESGTKVRFADHTYSLDIEQTILVAKDGKTKVHDKR